MQLQAEYQNLVSIIAKKDYETISKAIKVIKKILYPVKISNNEQVNKHIRQKLFEMGR